jgi:hypothetical protein
MKTEKKKKDYKAIENDEEAFEKFKKNFVKQSLRRASYRWPFKHMAKNEQRIERGFYRCQSCQGSFGPKDINLDHVDAVEDIKTGFMGWDKFIDRLFVKTKGFQVLCLTCHDAKTLVENEQRRANGLKAINRKKKKK